MKVIIFGATGTIGSLLVERALAEGHFVTAFSRSTGKLAIRHPNLLRFSGDATKQEDVSRAVN